jgi:YegS/Rv2252/BmrU family lipid kinase
VRVKVILNPWADHGRAIQMRDEIERWGARHGELEVVLTHEPGEAVELATEAAAAGYEVVAAAGGDGTVNEVANGLVYSKAAGQARLGIIPIGSGNDYAYGLGLGDDTEQAVARLFGDTIRMLDVAEVKSGDGRSRIACNGIGMGFDAAVAIESRKITRIHGFPMYVLATFRTMAFRYALPRLEASFDEEEVRQQMLLLAVGVGPRVGGGYRLTPDAEFDDGLLDSCLVNPVGRVTMLSMLMRVMEGAHTGSRHVTMRRSRTIKLASDQPLPVHIDGEVFARVEEGVREIEIECLPRALTVVT